MKEQINLDKIPKHVAIIMDGNGRWAKKKGLGRIFGHKNAIKSVRESTEIAGELGIEFLTLYAFSTENWNRPKREVNALMTLLVNTLGKEIKKLAKNNVQLKAIGQLDNLPKSCFEELQECIEYTKNNTGLVLTLALSYGGKEEILDAVRGLVRDCQSGEVNIEQIDAKLFSNYLYTSQMPEPELMIRTSGEQRISNFLLWQLAYAELYFTPVLWPDFRKEHFMEAIIDFQQRERRFGKTGEQIK